MPKEMLFKILSNRFYLQLFLIICVYFFNWFIFIALGLRLYKKPIKLRPVFPWVILGILVSLSGKIFLPNWFFIITVIGIITIAITTTGKIPWIKSLSSAVFVSFLTTCAIILFGLYIHFSESMADFFLKKPEGTLFGSLIEGSLPALALLLSLVFNFSLTDMKRPKKTKDLFGIVLFIVLYLAIYNLMFQFLSIMVDAPNHSFFSYFFLELFLVMAALLVFFFHQQCAKNEQQKHLQEELQQQIDQSTALIESLASEQREFRNKLQVVKTMIDLGKQEEVLEYINRISDGLIDTTIIGFVHPILGSAILEEMLQAREFGVEITMKSETSLKNVINAFKIGKLIKIIINYFLHNRVMKKEKINEILLSIGKTEDKYYFTVQYVCEKIAQAPDFEFVDRERHEISEAEGLIKELYGGFLYGYHQEILAKFSFWVPLVAGAV